MQPDKGDKWKGNIGLRQLQMQSKLHYTFWKEDKIFPNDIPNVLYSLILTIIAARSRAFRVLSMLA